MSEPIIRFDRVHKNYPLYHHITSGFKYFLFNLPKALRSIKTAPHEVLKDLSFEVKKGETLGIIGRNGVGKSTTLGLIAGVLRPTSGHITVKGKVLPLLQLGAGFHSELTGRENVMLYGILLGSTKKDILRKMDSIIAYAELGEFIDEPTRTYSGGMLARLGFSVIASLDPEILIIDEVLTVGDIQFQKRCLEKMREFKQLGVTIIITSHIMDDIRKICDRVLWIENKKIEMIDDTEKVLERYCAI